MRGSIREYRCERCARGDIPLTRLNRAVRAIDPPSPTRGEGKGKQSMDARDFIRIGMSAERTLVVPAERTVGHFVPGMPMVYATPMMILEMEMTSGDAIRAALQPGWVTVGTEVDIRHLAAALVGATVRTTAKVVAVERRVIRFEVEAFEGARRLGEGRHARGVINVAKFNERLAAK